MLRTWVICVTADTSNEEVPTETETHCWASHDCQNRYTMGKPGHKTRVSSSKTRGLLSSLKVRCVFTPSDEWPSINSVEKFQNYLGFKRGCLKRWAETNFQNHPLTKHISTLNQLRVLLDLSPNRWIAHPRSAQNAVSCGMYLDLVPNDKKVGNKNLHHLQRKGCFCTGILQLTKSSSKKNLWLNVPEQSLVVGIWFLKPQNLGSMPWAPTKKSQIFLLSSQASTFTNDSAVILASPPWATPLVEISYWPKDRSKYKRSNDSEIVRCTQTLTRLWLEWLWNVVGNTKQKHHFGSLQNTTQH